MRLIRTYRFSASHRLHSEQLTEDENRELYGKCNNPFGHGHDYIVSLAVSGRVETATGRVIAPGILDAYVHNEVVAVFDHKDMNADVPDFQGVPTTENLALEIDRRLRARWPFPQVELERIHIRETPRNTFELRVR